MKQILNSQEDLQLQKDGVTVNVHEDLSELKTEVPGKAPLEHTHDDRYYTEAEVDEKIDAVNRRYEMSLDGHTLVFNNGPAYVAGHKLVLL